MTEKKAKPRDETEIELRPDGWGRFEKDVDAAVKSGPKHRIPPTAPPVWAKSAFPPSSPSTATAGAARPPTVNKYRNLTPFGVQS